MATRPPPSAGGRQAPAQSRADHLEALANQILGIVEQMRAEEKNKGDQED